MKAFLAAFYFSFALTCPHSVLAVAPALELVRVDFWETDTPEGVSAWIQIKEDDLSATPISGVTKTSAWQKLDNGAIAVKPVAYASRVKPAVSACFRDVGSGAFCNPDDGRPADFADLYVKGVVVATDADGHSVYVATFQPLQLKKTDQHTYEYAPDNGNGSQSKGVEATAAFDHKVYFIQKFTITWHWSNEKDGTWKEIGSCEVPVYVTLDVPTGELIGKYDHQRTLLHIACTKGHNTTEADGLINAVWNYFSGRNVTRFDGQPLAYYKQWSGGNLAQNTRELIVNRDGECTAWVRLFLDLFKINGIRNENNYVAVRANESSGFFVKTWEVAGGPSYPGDPQGYKYKNVKGSPFYVNNNYNWISVEVVLTSFTPGQSNSQPQSDFISHYLARPLGAGGLLYDPSYGTTRGHSTFFNGIEIVSDMDDAMSVYFKEYFNTPELDIQINNLDNAPNDFIKVSNNFLNTINSY
ncbi:MAG: hypothetical protein SFV52_11830 [Saprospiraceae bacterium]|nr:hypothetical protein [Saprospiraceae bacterium]